MVEHSGSLFCTGSHKTRFYKTLEPDSAGELFGEESRQDPQDWSLGVFSGRLTKPILVER